ncbi:MAG TPA: hypothetical protein VEA38_03045, partial [Terriglobales bacterium]|nr:hypothetical protein [Terriglobales bacterium]
MKPPRSPRTVAIAAFALVAALGAAFLKQAADRATLERRLEAMAAADGLAMGVENEIQGVFGQLAALQAGREPPPPKGRIEVVLRTLDRRVVATLPPLRDTPDEGDLEALEGRGPVAAVMRGPGGARKVAARLPTGPHEGALVAVLDLDAFVVTQVLPRVAGFDYRLAAVTPRPSLVAQSTAAALDRPVERELRVGSGRWSVAVAPREGWVRWPRLALQGVLVLTAALCAALLAFDVARDRTVLRKQGTSARARLKEANRRLREEVGQRESLERQFS